VYNFYQILGYSSYNPLSTLFSGLGVKRRGSGDIMIWLASRDYDLNDLEQEILCTMIFSFIKWDMTTKW
jgi:hypothetical protein